MRIVLSEITTKRLLDAVNRRIRDIPDALAWRYSEYNRKNRLNLQRFYNIHNGKRCFIIANGPSLKRMDLTALKDEYTFSMNRAYLLYSEWGFTPTYYVCINELVIEQFATDILQLQMPKFINFNRKHLFNNIANDNSLMFLRTGLHLNDHFGSDVTQEISSGGTVTFACLQLAYYMGFSEVILIGLDHNFVEKGTPNKTVVRTEENDESHCHPGYFPKGIKWQLPDLYRSEIAYALAKKSFESDRRRVVDATIDGKCTIFEKVGFSDF